MTTDGTAHHERAAELFSELQSSICTALESLERGTVFTVDPWLHEGGGGGVTRVLTDGQVFEKAAVNWSSVTGELPEDYAAQLPGGGCAYRATGVSVVIHPRSPMVPTTHANFRCLAKGDRIWFGGGCDLTPYYLFRDDIVHFHRTLRDACDRHAPVADYSRFKKWCDEYFYLPHRRETRGLGGIFFDYLGADGAIALDAVHDFVADVGRAFVPAYAPIVARRRELPYGENERTWQLRRRGRYVEFNLLYDRGTVFGLKTSGRVESILMSLPPAVRWDYGVEPAPGS